MFVLFDLLSVSVERQGILRAVVDGQVELLGVEPGDRFLSAGPHPTTAAVVLREEY